NGVLRLVPRLRRLRASPLVVCTTAGAHNGGGPDDPRRESRLVSAGMKHCPNLLSAFSSLVSLLTNARSAPRLPAPPALPLPRVLSACRACTGAKQAQSRHASGKLNISEKERPQPASSEEVNMRAASSVAVVGFVCAVALAACGESGNPA